MIDQTNYTRDTEVEVEGKEGTWVVLNRYIAEARNVKYTLAKVDDASEVIQVLYYDVYPVGYVKPPQAYANQFNGLTVAHILADEDGLHITFDGGKVMKVGADMGQGQGYLTYGEDV